jgi:hypothetical protein
MEEHFFTHASIASKVFVDWVLKIGKTDTTLTTKVTAGNATDR